MTVTIPIKEGKMPLTYITVPALYTPLLSPAKTQNIVPTTIKIKPIIVQFRPKKIGKN
jgi:hypothetical protein